MMDTASLRWTRAAPLLHSQKLWTGLGLIASALMLLAFHQMLGAAVAEGERQRAAYAAEMKAMARCAALNDVQVRHACLARLAAGVTPVEPPMDFSTGRVVVQLER